MIHHEILSEEEFFGEFYADTYSDWATFTLVSQKMTVLQNIVLIHMMWMLHQQRQKTLLIDADTESENKTHRAGERSFVSTE